MNPISILEIEIALITMICNFRIVVEFYYAEEPYTIEATLDPEIYNIFYQKVRDAVDDLQSRYCLEYAEITKTSDTGLSVHIPDDKTMKTYLYEFIYCTLIETDDSLGWCERIAYNDDEDITKILEDYVIGRNFPMVDTDRDHGEDEFSFCYTVEPCED